MEGLFKIHCQVQPSFSCQHPLLAHAHACSNFTIRTTFSSLRKKTFKVYPGVHCFSAASDSNPLPFDIVVLEDYTRNVPSELLLVHAMVDDEEDEVLIYKGHSSSLMRATSSDLEDVLLPPDATINGIDRMKCPYNPENPKFIDKGLSWGEFLKLLRPRDS